MRLLLTLAAVSLSLFLLACAKLKANMDAYDRKAKAGRPASDSLMKAEPGQTYRVKRMMDGPMMVRILYYSPALARNLVIKEKRFKPNGDLDLTPTPEEKESVKGGMIRMVKGGIFARDGYKVAASVKGEDAGKCFEAETEPVEDGGVGYIPAPSFSLSGPGQGSMVPGGFVGGGGSLPGDIHLDCAVGLANPDTIEVRVTRHRELVGNYLVIPGLPPE